ncbi:MAG: hypothetical protein WCI77_06825 [Candidatus Omnitrophota bacterium]
MEDKHIKDNEISVHDVLNKIKDGMLDPRILSKDDRQACVETLTLEGLQASAIAQLLKKSDKTIARDIKEINAKNALSPNVDFVKETVGRFLKMSLNHHSYLMRLARNKEATISERALSEASAWKVLEGTIQRFQALGYLPSQPAQVVGSFFHHMDTGSEVSANDMRKTLASIEAAAKEAGILDAETAKRIDSLNARIEKTEIAQEIKQLEEKPTEQKEKSHE